jgi:site-specific DNA-methyltransferase (adenine-specific)
VKIERIKLAELRNDDQNARTHDQANLNAIAGSLEQFGQRKPIVIAQDNKVVAGNGTLTAARLIGWTEIDCVRVPADWTADQIKAYALADNRTAELAQWDEQVMASQLLDLQEAGFDIQAIGFELVEPAIDPATIQEDEIPENAPARSELGNIWQLGNHQLLCADSTDSNLVAKFMSNEKADMIFTDPPYGVNYQGINNDNPEGLEILLRQVFNNYAKHSKSGAAIYVFHSDRNADVFHKVFREKFHFSSMIIWFKNSLTLSQTDYQSQHEPCLYGWEKSASHKFFGDRKQISVWQVDKERVQGHTTPKPIGVVTKALVNSSKPTDLVIDFFAGSGSTLIACEKNNRRAKVIELDPKYCDVIIQRWETLTGLKAELVNANR